MMIAKDSDDSFLWLLNWTAELIILVLRLYVALESATAAIDKLITEIVEQRVKEN